MGVGEYAPERNVLAVLLIVGLILAAGMLLVLQPKVLAALTGKSTPQSIEVHVNIPDGIASNPRLNFVKSSITVKVNFNNTITWTDNDTSGQSHTVTTKVAPTVAAGFDSGPLSLGDTFTVTPTVAGTYQYHCIFHSWMIGTITVLAP
jgi:plastocyanin